MRYSHRLDQYDLNSDEWKKLQTFLEQREFKIYGPVIYGQYDWGLRGISTIIDSKVESLDAQKCGTLLPHAGEVGDEGLLVVGDSRLEKVVKEYLKRS